WPRAARAAQPEARQSVRDEIAVPAGAHHDHAIAIAEVEREVEHSLVESREADRLPSAQKLVLVLLADVPHPARSEEQVRQDEVEPRDAPDEEARPERVTVTQDRHRCSPSHPRQPFRWPSADVKTPAGQR